MDRDLVRELARRVVAEAAPDQARGFDTHAEAWFEDPGRARFGDAIRDDPLGNGLAAEIPNLVPLVMSVSRHVLSVLTSLPEHFESAATDLALEEGIRRGSRKIRRRGKSEPTEAATVPARQLDPAAVVEAYGGDFDKIREAAIAEGVEFGVDAEQARLIAGIFVIVLSQENPKPQASAE